VFDFSPQKLGFIKQENGFLSSKITVLLWSKNWWFYGGKIRAFMGKNNRFFSTK